MAPLYSAGEVPTSTDSPGGSGRCSSGPSASSPRPSAGGASRPAIPPIGGSGAENPHSGSWHSMILLLGQSPLQLIENQFAMLFEYAQRPFERMEHRLSNP